MRTGAPIRSGAVLMILYAFSFSAQTVSEYQVKAEFIERFTRFIDWPSGTALDQDDAIFTIGVIGKDPFGPFLDEMAEGRRIKGHQVIIRQFSDVKESTSCQILFISRSEKERLGTILKETAGKPVLTISDSSGFGREGVHINFYTSEGKIRFEINESAVERSRLRVTSKLYKLARIIESEGV